MQTSFPQLTPEQQQAIAASGGLPIQVQDPVTNKMYVLLEQPNDTALDDEYIREALSKGLAAIERGKLLAWDPERVKQEGRRRLAARKAQE
jgi:hypothetical protein